MMSHTKLCFVTYIRYVKKSISPNLLFHGFAGNHVINTKHWIHDNGWNT